MRYSTVRDSTVRRSTCANPWWATLRCATPRCAKSLTDATSLYWRAPLPSTRTGFLCAFWLRDPRFRAFRAQNRGFCALLPSGTPILRPLEHKIGVFVRFYPLEPSFSGFSSTKSAFLCSSSGTSGIGKRKSGLPAIHRAGFQNANTSEPDN